MIRCQTGRKFSIQSLITTSTSFGTVCTDGRDIVESANRGMKVFDKGKFDFSWVQPFEFVDLFKRFLHCGSTVLGVKFKWETGCRVSICVVRRFLYLDTDFVNIFFRVPVLPFFFLQTYLFRAYFKSLIKISKGFNKWTCFRKIGLNTILIVSIIRTATSVTTMIFRKYKLHVL